MMNEHILIKLAKKYKERNIKDFNDVCEYIIEKGYWVFRDTKEIMMLSNSSIIPMTKKEDIETGEDQKGEWS